MRIKGRKTMIRNLSFIAAVATVYCTAGCSSIRINLAGYTDSTTVPVSMEYTGVEVESAIEVVLTDTENDVLIESDANVLPYVEVYEDNRSIINIRYSTGLKLRGDGYYRTIVRIPYKEDIRSISASGASTVSSERPFVSESLNISVSGASRINCTQVTADYISMSLSGAGRVKCETLEAEYLDIHASGASSLTTSGNADKCNIQLDGASTLDGRAVYSDSALYVNKCSGSLSGGSTAWFSTDGGTIECSLSGGSHIYYSGTAYSNSTVSGGSSVEAVRF